MRRIAIITLLIGFGLLLFYLLQLCIHGYINPTKSFSIERSKEIAPFVGSFIAVFFSLAGTLLILENLRMQNAINARNQLLTQKNQFESIFFNLLSLHNKIANEIDTDITTSYNAKFVAVKGRKFFELLTPSITFDFTNSPNKSKETLQKIFRKYFAIHSSDMGHYFRNLYHIVNFVDKSAYFLLIADNSEFFQQKDYIKILRAQLTNSEITCLAVNGLIEKGSTFKPLIEKYELLRNIHFDFDLPVDDYWESIPAPEILITEYPHLNSVYEYQKNNS
jgi:hypothetical protein